MMRILCLLLGVMSLTLSLVFAAGCQSTSKAPSPGMGDPYPAPLNDPQISVLSEELRPWLGFHPAIVLHEPGEVMFVEVPMRNLASRQYLLEYRILFYEERGMELKPIMDWKMISVDPKQTVRLTANSMDSSAENYRLEIRWSR